MSQETMIRAIEQYSDMLMRICVTYMKNEDESEDVIQTVFMKLMTQKKEFQSEEHLKAWLIRVTVNQCKDVLKGFFRKNTTTLDEAPEPSAGLYPDEDKYDHVRRVIWQLPEKYRIVIYLFYYEEYETKEIAEILKISPNNVSTRIRRAKEQLRISLTRGNAHE